MFMKKFISGTLKVGIATAGAFAAALAWQKNREASGASYNSDASTVSGLREWNSALTREIVRSHRDARDVCIAVVNVEPTIKVARDEWLREVETEFAKSVRGSDLLSHDEQGEFYLLFPEAGLDEGYEAIERMKESLPENTSVNASVAVWDHCETAAELVSRSIKALQAEKKNVKSNIVVSEAPSETKAPVSDSKIVQ